MQSLSAEPIPFIVKAEGKSTSEYQITKEAQVFLSKIDKPFSIVTVAGLYRTGKSYLLNRIVLNKQTGFGVGSTVNACTKGLWIWGEVLRSTDNQNFLVIDTEGLGALDEQTNHDMKIICLAVLLSTTFIYNSQGSIDENALQTLSLVLNLVNNIDQGSHSTRPNFIWVVRDFALQLVNQKGETITPNQYLELALNSEQVNKEPQKLQIRSTILNAFKERDCFTLVKPIIDQNKLQKLDQISMEDLRGQFVEQSLYLRKRILANLKPITFNKKESISGIDYVRMAKNYVTAVNEGRVPCMLDTWTYIKEEKAREAINYIQVKLDEQIKIKLNEKLPVPNLELQKLLEHIWKEITNDFQRLTYEETDIEPLEKVFHSLQSGIRRENLKQTKSTLKNLMNNQYQAYHRKIILGQFQNFQSFREQLMNSYRDCFLQKHKEKFDDIEQALQNFIHVKIIEGFSNFDKKNQNEISKQAHLLKEIQLKSTEELQIMSRNTEQQKQRLQKTIQELDRDNFNLKKQKQELQHSLQEESSLNDKLMTQIQRKTEQLASVSEKMINQINQKSTERTQTKQAMYIKEKELEKDRAVYIQKEKQTVEQLLQLEINFEEVKKKFKLETQKLQAQKRETNANFEIKILQISQENKAVSAQNQVLQQHCQQLNSQLKASKSQLQKVIVQYNRLKERSKAQLHNAELSQKSSFQFSQLQAELKRSDEQISKLSFDIKDCEIRNRQLEDQLANLKLNGEKQLAIHVQKIQFLSMEMNELRNRNEQLKKNYQEALQNIQDNSRNLQDNLQIKIVEQKCGFQRNLRQAQDLHDQKIKELQKKHQQIVKTREDLQLQLSIEKKTLQNKEKEWKSTNHSLQQLCQKMEQKIISTERGHQNFFNQKQNYFKLRVKQLQQEVQDIKERTTMQLKDNQTKSQQALTMLKNYSEVERVSWEKRLNDEKERSQKKLRTLNQQLQLKFNEEKQILQDQNAELHDKLVQMGKLSNQKIQNIKYDYDINLQKTVNKFMDQKVQLTKQIALIEQELTLTRRNLEKQLEEVKNSNEKQLEQRRCTIITQYQQTIARIRDEKETIQSKYDVLKKCNKNTEQDNLKLKNELQRQKAVYKERQCYYQKKIVELENTIKSQLESYNLTIQRIKEANQSQRRQLNNEIQKVKDHNLALQEERNQIMQNAENQNTMLQTKISYLQTALKRGKEDHTDLMHKFEVTVKHLNHKKRMEELEKESSQDSIRKVKEDSDLAIDVEKTRVCRIIKDHEDKVASLNNQIKALKDKVLLYQISSKQHRRGGKDQEVQKRRHTYQQWAQQYVQKIKKLQDALCYEKKQHQKTAKDFQLLERSINLQNGYSTQAMEKSQRSSISGYSGSANTRYFLTDNKNVSNTSANMSRKSSQGPLIPPKKGRVIEQEQDFTGIKKYNKY